MSRFIIKKSTKHPNHWVLTDTLNGCIVIFEDGLYNETQEITLLEDDTLNKDLSLVMREIGEWAVRYHSSKCFKKPPYGFEYDEKENLYLYRRNAPRWRLLIEDGASPITLAASLRKAAEFLTKKNTGG